MSNSNVCGETRRGGTMPRTEIRIAGFGGQGVVLSGVLLGRAAVLHGGRYAIQTQTYGAAARGGAARSDVIIDDAPIVYPQVTHPDIMTAFTNQALGKYIDDLRPDAVLIIDSGLVHPPEGTSFDIHGIPATNIAVDSFGRSIVANMVMLGYMTALTGIIGRDALESAIREGVPKGTEDLNLTAFAKGFELARNGG